MKKLTSIFIILLVALLGLTACTVTEVPTDQGNQEQNSQENSNDVKTVVWAESLEETIMIEGMEEPIALTLFDGGGNFVTYIPEDFLAESVGSGEGDSYRFYAGYGGNKVEDVYFQVFLFPESVTEKPEITDLRELFSLQHLDFAATGQADKFFAWSLEEYGVVYGSSLSAYVMLGQHQGQYFSMVIHYPWEYGDGFEPRVKKILEHFYWTDANEYLVK